MPVGVRDGAAIGARESDVSELVVVLSATKARTLQLEDVIIVSGRKGRSVVTIGSLRMHSEIDCKAQVLRRSDLQSLPINGFHPQLFYCPRAGNLGCGSVMSGE